MQNKALMFNNFFFFIAWNVSCETNYDLKVTSKPQSFFVRTLCSRRNPQSVVEKGPIPLKGDEGDGSLNIAKATS